MPPFHTHDLDNTAAGYDDVARQVRRWIVDQRMAPGTQLPKQTELAEHFGVSKMTMVRAMKMLQDDGLVVAIRRAGSFVAETPPHLRRYGLLLPDSPTAIQTNRFTLALAHEAARVTETSDLSIRTYYGIDGTPHAADRMALYDDLDRCQLAGLIILSPLFRVKDEAFMLQSGLPRVAIATGTDREPHLTKVTYNPRALAPRAVERLAKLGCKRIAALVNDTVLDAWEEDLQTLTAQYDLEWRPEWLQGCFNEHPAAGRRIVQLLLSSPAGERPDGLIIGDDNLVEEACRGVVQSGVDVGRELQVIAHCNFPWPTPAAVPVTRLGLDTHAVIETCLASLTLQQETRSMAPHAHIQTLFQDELTP